MSVLNEALEANRKYAEAFGDKGALALPPSKRFAILTCMDARLDPAGYAGLSAGNSHVIRNAGGRATDDAIRSLAIPTSCLDAGMVRYPSHGLRNAIIHRRRYRRLA